MKERNWSKKAFAAACAVSLTAGLAAGCGGPAASSEEGRQTSQNMSSEEESGALLPEISQDLFFSSGAGAWSTELSVKQDGSFSGSFHDSDMGVTGEGYPNGTVYYCVFTGRFSDIRQVDNHTWSMRLEEITPEQAPGIQSIENGTLLISEEPYGLETGSGFLLYSPETPTSGLSEEFLSWWPGRYEDPKPETMSGWGLLNQETGYGFFSGF